MTTKKITVSSMRPPIVAVLGHVDHGKTTLLDTIRKSNIVDAEYGGITQSIGAYQVEVKSSGKEKKDDSHLITFIDTPGHEAFKAMRSRGATVADLVLLVVASDDSVMPQTVESISMIKQAKVPFIVVATKIDMPGANLDKLRADLARHEIQTEGFGGDIPFIPVSAKEKKGISDLLDMILLVAEMQELKGDAKNPLHAIVIETRIDKGKGMVATVVVKDGTLIFGEKLFDGDRDIGKVRALFDEHGKSVKEAYPSQPVEVLGFTSLPLVGSIITSEKKVVISNTIQKEKKVNSMPDFLAPVTNDKKLSIFLKANTAGSLEAIIGSLHEKIDIVHMGVGTISESDVLVAKTSKAILIGFQVPLSESVKKLAYEEKVIVRTYDIIYELLEELAEVAMNLKEITREEKELGKASIIAEFPFNGERIAGCKIIEGRLARGDMVKFIRGEAEVFRARIKSIRKGKDPIDKATTGHECGVLFDTKVDFLLGDGIIPITQ
jgi:translation initiation factor IF-2